MNEFNIGDRVACKDTLPWGYHGVAGKIIDYPRDERPYDPGYGAWIRVTHGNETIPPGTPLWMRDSELEHLD